MPFIYKITNSTNSKVYIGQTIYSLSKRMREHIYLSEHPEFDHKCKIHSAMRKYGCDKFFIEPIEECSEAELDDREIYWIEQYDSFYHGYNCTLGGGGGKKISTDSILKEWSKGKSISETADALGIDRQCVSRRIHSVGTSKDEISERSIKRISDANKKPVFQYDLDGNFIREYESLSDAQNKTGVNLYCIRGVTCGQHVSAGGFQWRKYKAEKIGKVECSTGSTKKPVYQYNAESGELVGEYRSITQAAKSMGIKSHHPIERVCTGKNKVSCGYKWSFEKRKNYYDLEA